MKMTGPNTYQEQGFKNREEYLKMLCESYPPESVYALADILGPNEDFDGLVVSLEDYFDEN